MEKSLEIERVVKEAGLAKTMKSGSLPVLATPQLAAWMEEASCLLLELPEGKTSVGTRLDLSHLKASPLGATIRIQASLIAEEGRRLSFAIEAYEGEALVGKASHERAVVDIDRFLGRVYPQGCPDEA